MVDGDDFTRAHVQQQHRHWRPFDPFYIDLVGFLQVLIDVMVSCPVPSLRSRGHSAMSAFLSATDAVSRFRVLKRMIERCPWPNATGLLLDTFRREMDGACRAFSWRVASAGGSPPVDGVTSPFVSAQAGKFVREQLRKACRKSPPASLLLDMDSRTGGLMLARYAHALDRLGGGGAGRLELRRPDTLHKTVLLVQVIRRSIRVSITTYLSGAWVVIVYALSSRKSNFSAT